MDKGEFIKQVNEIMNEYAYCWTSFVVKAKNLHIVWTSVNGDTYDAKDIDELKYQLTSL